jgi:hypothetical protein
MKTHRECIIVAVEPKSDLLGLLDLPVRLDPLYVGFGVRSFEWGISNSTVA